MGVKNIIGELQVDGSRVLTEAMGALTDGSGNVITSTYATKAELGAIKSGGFKITDLTGSTWEWDSSSPNLNQTFEYTVTFRSNGEVFYKIDCVNGVLRYFRLSGEPVLVFSIMTGWSPVYQTVSFEADEFNAPFANMTDATNPDLIDWFYTYGTLKVMDFSHLQTKIGGAALETTDKTIVGAINEVNRKIGTGGGTSTGGTSSSGEKELPDIDPATDEGKVLGVVNGVWNKMTVPSGGSGSIETAEVDIFPLQTVSGFAPGQSFGGAYVANSPTSFELKVGKTYYVEWDGETYICEAMAGSLEGMEIIYIGNDSMLGGSNNGPFTIGYFVLIGIVGFIAIDAESSHDIRVYQVERLDQADWAQNDSTQANYINNRPFYETPETKEILPATDVTLYYDAGLYGVQLPATTSQIAMWREDWTTASVNWGGTVYECEPQYLQGMKCIGNIDLMMGTGDNGIPFIFVIGDGATLGADMMMALDFVNMGTEILPYQTLSPVAVEGTSYYAANVDTVALTEGEKYYVLDPYGSEVPFVATSYTSGDMTYVGLGNPSIMGLGDDSGEALFFYTSTASDGTQSSAYVNFTGATCNFSIVYAPDIASNISVSINALSVKTLDPKFIENIDYETQIINKPFGVVPSGTVVIDTSVTFGLDNVFEDYSNYFAILFSIDNPTAIIEGAEYTVSIGDNSYTGVGVATSDGMSIQWSMGDNFQESYLFYFPPENMYLVSLYAESIPTDSKTNVKIALATDIVKKIDSQYLPASASGLPESTTSDSGKVLTIDSTGAAVWETPASGLPDATTSDSGKILTINSSGTATWTTPASGLPDVTTTDNDKVLKVVNGAWSVADKELPTSTTDDNGKFLRIVDGAPAWVTIQNGEEATF